MFRSELASWYIHNKEVSQVLWASPISDLNVSIRILNFTRFSTSSQWSSFMTDVKWSSFPDMVVNVKWPREKPDAATFYFILSVTSWCGGSFIYYRLIFRVLRPSTVDVSGPDNLIVFVKWPKIEGHIIKGMRGSQVDAGGAWVPEKFMWLYRFS